MLKTPPSTHRACFRGPGCVSFFNSSHLHSNVSMVAIKYFCSVKVPTTCTLERVILGDYKVTDFQRDPFHRFLSPPPIGPELMLKSSLDVGQNMTSWSLEKEQRPWQHWQALCFYHIPYIQYFGGRSCHSFYIPKASCNTLGIVNTK